MEGTDRYYQKVNIGVISLKGYAIRLRSLDLEPNHQMKFTAIPKTDCYMVLVELSVIPDMIQITLPR